MTDRFVNRWENVGKQSEIETFTSSIYFEVYHKFFFLYILKSTKQIKNEKKGLLFGLFRRPRWPVAKGLNVPFQRNDFNPRIFSEDWTILLWERLHANDFQRGCDRSCWGWLKCFGACKKWNFELSNFHPKGLQISYFSHFLDSNK